MARFEAPTLKLNAGLEARGCVVNKADHHSCSTFLVSIKSKLSSFVHDSRLLQSRLRISQAAQANIRSAPIPHGILILGTINVQVPAGGSTSAPQSALDHCILLTRPCCTCESSFLHQAFEGDTGSRRRTLVLTRDESVVSYRDGL